MNLTPLSTSHKWNHVIFIHLCLVCFTSGNSVFKVRPYCSEANSFEMWIIIFQFVSLIFIHQGTPLENNNISEMKEMSVDVFFRVQAELSRPVWGQRWFWAGQSRSPFVVQMQSGHLPPKLYQCVSKIHLWKQNQMPPWWTVTVHTQLRFCYSFTEPSVHMGLLALTFKRWFFFFNLIFTWV